MKEISYNKYNDYSRVTRTDAIEARLKNCVPSEKTRKALRKKRK